MMTAEQLKGSILQLAMQGKLVEQRPEEGTGEELYKKIQAEKKRLINEGKIKKHKSQPDISEVEIPFDIPETWKWTHLDSSITLLSGADLTPEKYNSNEKGTVYITGASNIENGKVIINRWTEHPKNIAHKGDLLLTCKGTVGKTAILELNEAHIARQIMAITPIICCVDYVNYYIQFIVTDLKKKAKSMIPGIERASVLNAPFPLPPLAEQKRIVAKIEKLMPFVDQYAAASTKLNTLNTTFPEMMKKSILQEAVQGKLVPQDPNDEPASSLLKKIAEEKKRLIKEGKIKKQKPLPVITEDEIPFDIPESWEWCYVGDLFDHNTGKAMNSSAKQGNRKGSVRKFITTSNLYWNRFDLSTVKEMFFSDDELARCTATKRDILMCEGGAYFGRTAIWNYDYDICFQNHVHRLRPYVNIKEEFFYYLFFFYRTTGLMKSKGTAMPGLSSAALHGLVIPLPPLAEQERIVSKIEELIPCTEQLSRWI